MTTGWEHTAVAARTPRKPGLHIWCVAIASYERLGPIHAARSTLNELRRFWHQVARNQSDHKPQADILSIRLLEVGADCTRQRLLELFEEALDKDDFQEKDTLFFYWMGHGESPLEHDRLLFLPQLEDPKHSSTRQVFWLQKLAEYFGKLCAASDQLFFFDCCSMVGKYEPGELPVHWPKTPQRENGSYRKRQLIVVGSGYRYAAISSPEQDSAKPSLFAKALTRALSGFAADQKGRIGVPSHLCQSLASLLAEEWIERGYAQFPKDLGHKKPIWTRFVTELPPSWEYRCQGDHIPFGKSLTPQVHFLFGAVGSSGDKNVRLKSHIEVRENKVPALSVVAWHGNGSHELRYRAILFDESNREVLHCNKRLYDPVVVHEWYSL